MAIDLVGIARDELATHTAMDAAERAQRLGVIEEALSWCGTPFVNQAAIKGAGVDCAMLIVRVFVDSHIVAPFDPRPYPSQWHLHKEEEKFLDIIRRMAIETGEKVPGNVAVFQSGRCYAHGAILIGAGRLCHAYIKDRFCTISDDTEGDLKFLRTGKLRPVKYFDGWAKKRLLEAAR